MEADQTLADEARRRPVAAAASIAAALLILGSYVGSGVVFADAPRAPLVDAIGSAARPGAIGEAQSLKVPFYEFYADRGPALIAASTARAVGFLLIGFALTFLARAVRARSGTFPKLASYIPTVGGVLSALSYVVSPVGTVLAVRSFLDGPRTVDAATEVTSSTLVATAALIGVVGGFALALGLILVSLHAMRVGLLTRFMGVLGILAGVLTFIPIGSPLPVVQCFWLAALGALFLGRWPGGSPPAWRTGRAEPWPTQQELREQRDRNRAGGAPAAVAATPPAAAPDREHPASNKRKRKRRT
jgi:hypothetical protein